MYNIKTVDDFSIVEVKRGNLEVELLNYGASIYSLRTKDYLGNFGDIVLKYQNIEDYINNNIYLNATIGPVSGRVKNAVIKTDDKIYHLDKNSDNLHTLHSGSLALSFKFFDFEITEYEDYTEVIFLYEEDSIINYMVRVFYQIYDDKIRINYEVETDKDFVFNLTNHAYFNLSGDLKENIRNHKVWLKSNLRHKVDEFLVFTGEVKKETNAYDFTGNQDLDRTINELEKTPKGGIDDIYYFPGNDLRNVMAVVFEPVSRRMMKVRSSYDHLVFYSHNNINKLPLEHLLSHQKHYALCFECQKSPYGFCDKHASNPYLKKGKLYQESIIFEFSVK